MKRWNHSLLLLALGVLGLEGFGSLLGWSWLLAQDFHSSLRVYSCQFLDNLVLTQRREKHRLCGSGAQETTQTINRKIYVRKCACSLR